MTLARRSLLASLAAAASTATAKPAFADNLRKIHIVQASPSLAYLPLSAARALGSFAPQGLDPFWTDLPGGDRACLAALERGEADVAALGAESVLAAALQGNQVQMVAALTTGIPFDLVLGNPRIETSAISPADDPLETRLRALKGIPVGVTALGGQEEQALRWLARLAGLQPDELQLLPIPPPLSLNDALEAGRIGAALVSPLYGLLAEQARIGQVIIRLSDQIPALTPIPALVLAIRTPVDAETRALLLDTIKAMRAATDRLATEPAAMPRLTAALYSRLPPPLLATAIDRLRATMPPRFRFQPTGIAALLAYTGLAEPPHPPWTNQYCDEA